MTTQNDFTIQNTTKVGLVLLLALMPVLLRAQGLGRPFYESIYSMTGKCWQDNGTVMETYNHSAFYAKIYEDCLVETSGVPIAKDHYYYYIGNNKQNSRVYQNNRTFYIVDQNYNLTKVIESYDYRFGNNVKKYFYHEIIKGDRPQQNLDEIMDEYRRQIDLLELERNVEVDSKCHHQPYHTCNGYNSSINEGCHFPHQPFGLSQRETPVSHEHECWDCYGLQRCPRCAGNGRIEPDFGTRAWSEGRTIQCSNCNGTGLCPTCKGSGKLYY